MYLQENPAAKLYDILSEVKKLTVNNPNIKFKVAWSNVLGIAEKDLDEILLGVSNTQYLYRQTKEVITNNDRLNNTRNQTFLVNIYNALYLLNLQGNMNSFNQHLTKETLTALSYMSDSIEFLYNLNKSLLTDEDRSELIHKIDDLIEDFINSNLPEDLISVCADNLMNIKNALVHYKIYGAKGLEESTAKAIGNVYLKGNTAVDYQQNENIKKFFSVIENIKLLLTTSESTIKLASMAEPMFTLLMKK